MERGSDLTFYVCSNKNRNRTRNYIDFKHFITHTTNL